MKIKSFMIIALLLTSFIAQADTCRELYDKEIRNNDTIGNKVLDIDDTGRLIPFIGYGGGALIFGSYTAAATGFFVLPLALIAEHFIEDAIKDDNLANMVRVINEAEFELKILARPVVNPAQKIVIPVDGKTKTERKAQRKQNRLATREANIIKRVNKVITKENNKGKKLFSSIIKELQKSAPDTTNEQVALLILDADVSEKLCNGDIRNISKDLKLRVDFISPQGTLKEQKQAKKHNKKIRKYNEKVFRLKDKKQLALKSHLVKFLKAQI